MNTLAIILFIGCVFGSTLAQDCNAKIKDFHTCVENGQKKDEADGKAKFEALKVKIDACYTDNGCTAPAKQDHAKGGASSAGASGQGSECRKAVGAAMKKNFEECIQKSVPGFTFPQKDGGEHHEGGHHRGGFNAKDDNKALAGCAKAQAVRDCKKALFTSNRPSQDEMKAKFQANCAAKDICLNALGADCQAQMQKVKKAMCECGQQQKGQMEQIRGSIAACANEQKQPSRNGGGGHGGQSGKKRKRSRISFVR